MQWVCVTINLPFHRRSSISPWYGLELRLNTLSVHRRLTLLNVTRMEKYYREAKTKCFRLVELLLPSCWYLVQSSVNLVFTFEMCSCHFSCFLLLFRGLILYLRYAINNMHLNRSPVLYQGMGGEKGRAGRVFETQIHQCHGTWTRTLMQAS